VDTDEARKQIRETITAIRKVFRNKDWRAWADAWLAGTDRTSESAMAMSKAMVHVSPTTLPNGQRLSHEVLLVGPAGNAALMASFVEDLVQGHYKGDLPEWLSSQITQGCKNSKKM
jgi:hypothetical protein